MNLKTFFSLPYKEEKYRINPISINYPKAFEKHFVYSDAFLKTSVRIVKYGDDSYVHIYFTYNFNSKNPEEKNIDVNKLYIGDFQKIKDKILITKIRGGI